MAHKQRALALLAALSLGMLACMKDVRLSLRGLPPQSWPEELGPVIPHDTYPAECTKCHTENGWNEIREDFAFDHAAETGEVLEGAHATALCLRCHNDRGPVALFAQRGCRGCHEDVHRGRNGADCEACHNLENWRMSEEVESHARTRFPLFGVHAAVPCYRCHVGAEVGNFNLTDTECETCHMDAYRDSGNPAHVAQGFPTDCERCHTPVGAWKTGVMNHGGIVDSCFGCHVDDYNATLDPPHPGWGIPTDCERCHSPRVGWVGGIMDHTGIVDGCLTCHTDDYNGSSDPPHLAGGIATDCERCHDADLGWAAGVMDHLGIVDNCLLCHLDDYNGSSDPPHAAGGMPTDCERCHDPDLTWPGALMDHTGIFSNCFPCHVDDFNASSDPPHAAWSFPTDCQYCHDANLTWPVAVMDHTVVGTDCATCHMAEYEQAGHDPINYPLIACRLCHSPYAGSW